MTVLIFLDFFMVLPSLLRIRKESFSKKDICPVDTGRKLNVHQTFNLRPVSTGWSVTYIDD